MVESLLKGRNVAFTPVELRVHVWFSEGLAEAVTGGTVDGAIRDLGYLNYLTTKYGQLSPISFETDDQVGDWSKKETALACSEYHYPMYQLAVEYLMDADGFGKSPQDLAGIFTDMADGSDFPTAFENRLGISLTDYEEQFFDLMSDYLDEDKSISAKRASLAWLVLIAGSLIALAWRLARSAWTRRGMSSAWVLVTLLFGPLGLLGYLLTCRQPGRHVSNWQHALRESMFSVTGNAAGLIFLFVSISIFVPGGSPDPLGLLLPFLVGWWIFRAALAAARSRGWYRIAVRRPLLAEFTSAILILAGLLAVLIPMSEPWWFSLDSRTFFFWGVFSAGAIVGTIIVYPYNVWLVRRALSG